MRIISIVFLASMIAEPLFGFIIGGQKKALTPSEFSSREEFVAAYVENEISNLSEEERETDARRLGGDKLRRNKLRRDAERTWKLYLSNKEKVAQGRASSGQVAPKTIPSDDAEYLKGLPLEGLFGIELGEKIDTMAYERVANSSTYRFKPKKNFRLYKNYEFSVTPITRKVYGIRASGMSYLDQDGQMINYDAELLKTRMAFEKRFQKKIKPSFIKTHFRLIFPGADGSVAREIVVKLGTSITAIDLKLKELAEKERQEMMQKEANDSVGSDVEAP